ncbi:MAG: hypothetical protein IT260_10565 [Saprospiraceae bacterium]|nr:hypothetical protein [Saprospiraceae bacterium]
MRNSLLGQLYFGLAHPERQGLLRALQNESLNRRPEVTRLFEFLETLTEGQKTPRRASRHTSTPQTDKEAAFAFVFFPKKETRQAPAPYHDGKMRHLMSYALQTLRQYLAWQDWQADAGQVALHLCRGLKKRGLDRLFDKEHPRALAELDASGYRSTDYFYFRYALEVEAWEYFRAAQRHGEGNLQAVAESFSAYVAINTLRQGCATLAQKTLADKELALPYLQETLALARQGFFAGNPAVETYFACYQTLAEPDNDQAFTLLKTQIGQYGVLFPDAELRDLYILGINFCIRRLNAGQRHYIQEGFDLYRTGLERQVFLENGHLSRFTYRNILNLALALGEWDWALEYLHTFAPYLPPNERDNIFHYNLATYYFRRPDHDKALELLRQVEFRDVLYNFDARRMLLRIYYERKEEQALESLFDSFAVYLQRHRDAGYHRDMYRNLLRFAKRLLYLRPDDRPAQARLRDDIERTAHVAEREWLLSMLDN